MKQLIKYSSWILVLVVAIKVGDYYGNERAKADCGTYLPDQTSSVKMVYPTGYEVLDEMNKYRIEEGLPPFVLDSELCDNIVERWDHYQTFGNHDGLEEFVAKEHGSQYQVTELLVSGYTAEEMVDKLKSSPSHDLYMKTNNRICIYSASGYTVALLRNEV